MDYIPSTDAGLRSYAENISTRLSAEPVEHSITVAVAATLAAKYAAYDTALSAALNPETRGGATIRLKSQTRKELVDFIRDVAKVVQSSMTVTDQQRFLLGLPIHDQLPSPAFQPNRSPGIRIVSVNGRTVRGQVFDPEEPARRGRPDFAWGIHLKSAVGETAPEDINLYKDEGFTGRTTFEILFPNEVAPGAKVWFTAAYVGSRKEHGPACLPVGTQINYGGDLSEAA